MNEIEFDTSRIGFLAVIKDWQLETIKVVWSHPEGVSSSTVWNSVVKALNNEPISKASIINFLEAMREMLVIRGDDATGKGGHHYVYHPPLDEEGFRKYIVETMLTCLLENFPAETRKAISKIL